MTIPISTGIDVGPGSFGIVPTGRFERLPESFYGYNAQGTANNYNNQPVATQAFNLGLGCSADIIIAESNVKSPADMIAVSDAPYVLAVHPFIETLQPQSRHNQKANVLFCDGHIGSNRRENWTARTDANASRWNNDNLPHQELWQ